MEAADATNGYVQQTVGAICDLAVIPDAQPADLSLTKSVNNPTPVAGERVIFTLTLQNDGPGDATGVEVTDLLPEGLEFDSATPDTDYNLETGIWNVGTLESGSSAKLTIIATVAANPPGQIINTAEVTAVNQSDPDSTPNNRNDEPGEDDTASSTLNLYRVSPNAGDIVINEVLFDQSGGTGAADNDEFIELYNAGSGPVDLSGWQLIDANLISKDSNDNTFDGTNGNINGKEPYTFPAVTLAPGEYAIIWIGQRGVSRDVPTAAFQTWLGQSAKLKNTGDDVWLYDTETRIVDYVAFGDDTAVNTPPPDSLSLWDATYNQELDNTDPGQSISLTPNGEDGNTSACWEPTTSGDAGPQPPQQTGRCATHLPTTDSDAGVVGSTERKTSVAQNNNAFETRLTGTVFYDDGLNGGDANNALQEVNEQGVPGIVVTAIVVTATDGTNTVSTTTDGAGNYSLLIPDTFGSSVTLSHVQRPATGYNDGANITLATQYGDEDAARVSFTLADASTGVTYNFGVARPSTLRPDQSGQVGPGSVISYTHLFTPGTLGAVDLSVTGSYTYQVFRDVDCDGIVQLDEQVDVLTSGFVVDESWPRTQENTLAPCALELRVIVPEGEPSGRVDLATLSAELTYANNVDVIEILSVTDVTTVTAGGRLELSKRVANTTQGTDFSTVGEGEPGDVLEYCIGYQNLGTQTLTQTRLGDPVPFFTSFQTGIYSGQDIRWTHSGTVQNLSAAADGDEATLSGGVVQVAIGEVLAGETGEVCYSVRIR